MARISLNTRFNHFITWIRPDPDRAEDARKQRDDVKDRIKGKAEGDGLIVRSMPNSGSFAKATGLRRHMMGEGEHEGQDIDCPFVLSKRDEDGDLLKELLNRFERYAQQSYPETPRALTKSSVRLDFVASKRRFDLVPMLAVDGTDDEQVLLRAGGDRRRTSIQKHVEFVKARTGKSQALQGPVAFNDGVRLLKWWREYQVTKSKILTEVPTFFVELLCAKAFDEVSVRGQYPETLQNWFDRIQAYATSRQEIVFSDFTTARGTTVAQDKWRVIDPVNPENNAVPGAWGSIQIDEFRDWARNARDRVQQAIAFDMRGQDADAVAVLADVFGNAFKNHSEP